MSIPTLLRPYIGDVHGPLTDEELSKALKPNMNSFREGLGDTHLPAPDSTLPLNCIDLSVRSYNCLRRLGAETLADLRAVTFRDLLRTQNFGLVSLVNIIRVLDEFDITSVQEVTASTGSTEASSGALTSEDVDILIKEVAERGRLSKVLKRKRLPFLQPSFQFESLHLTVRTWTRLEQIGIIKNPEILAGYTIGDLLKIDGFGVSCVQDLVTALRPFCAGSGKPLDEGAFANLQVLLERLNSIEGALSITREDTRFGKLVQRVLVGDETFAEFPDRVNSSLNTNRFPPEVVGNTELLVVKLEEANNMLVEQEIASLVRNFADERNTLVFLQRHGFLGGEEMTLEEIGHGQGVTRQRIEQICSKIEKKFRTGDFLPILDRCLKAICELGAVSTGAGQQVLKAAGLTHVDFSGAALLSYARLVDRAPEFALHKVSRSRVLGSTMDSTKLRRALSFAKKQIKRAGAVRMQGIVDVFEGDPPEALVRDVIMSQRGFAWLDSSKEWFWFAENRSNRLLNRLEKVLAVTARIRLSDLKAALRRDYRMQASALPLVILESVCRQGADLRIEGDFVVKTSLNPPEVLSEVEQTMVRILRSLGGIAKREEFELVCSQANVLRPTFFQYIDNSPVFVKHTRGVYGLVGCEVTPSIIEELKPRFRRGKVLRDYGWSAANTIWVVYCLSEAAAGAGILGIPSALREYVDGDFEIKSDGSAVSISNGTIWSLGSIFRDRRVSAGQLVAVTFDVKNRTIDLDFDSKRIERQFLEHS